MKLSYYYNTTYTSLLISLLGNDIYLSLVNLPTAKRIVILNTILPIRIKKLLRKLPEIPFSYVRYISIAFHGRNSV